MKLSEFSSDQLHFKALIYGDSGAGKTILATSLAQLGEVEVWDFDHKISSAVQFYKNKPEILSNVEVHQFAQLNPEKRIPELEKLLNKVKEYKSSNKPLPFKTLVIDSVTTLSEMIMEDYIVRSQKGIKRGVEGLNALQDYQLLDKHMLQLVTGLLGLPCNVIFLGHIEIKTDPASGAIIRRPLMKGSFANKFSIYFEEVYVAKIDNSGNRILQTQPDNTFKICRTQRQLPKEVPADLIKIIKGQ